MQLSSSRHLKAVRALLLHPKADVGVQLPEQPVSQMAGGDVFSFLARQRAVIDHKVHGNGGLGDLLEGNSLRILRGADRIADVNVRDAGDGHDGAKLCLGHFHTV